METLRTGELLHILRLLSYPSLINLKIISKHFNIFCKDNSEIKEKIEDFIYFKKNFTKYSGKCYNSNIINTTIKDKIVPSIIQGDIYPLKVLNKFNKPKSYQLVSICNIIYENIGIIENPYVTIDFLLSKGMNLDNVILLICVMKKNLNKFIYYSKKFSLIHVNRLKLEALDKDNYLLFLKFVIGDQIFYNKLLNVVLKNIPEYLVNLSIDFDSEEAIKYLIDRGIVIEQRFIVFAIKKTKRVSKYLYDNYGERETIVDVIKDLYYSRSTARLKFLYETLQITDSIYYEENINILINNQFGDVLYYLIKHKIISSKYYRAIDKNHFAIRYYR